VTFGPNRGKLKGGKEVEVTIPGTDKTHIVKPEDVLIGGGPGAVGRACNQWEIRIYLSQILIVVNCSPHNLEELLSSSAFHEYQQVQSQTTPQSPHVVVHRVAQSVWGDPRYQDWLGRFGPTTQVSENRWLWPLVLTLSAPLCSYRWLSQRFHIPLLSLEHVSSLAPRQRHLSPS
jgi:hypothetical protein